MAGVYDAQATNGALDERIAHLAATQHGAFSRAQLTAIGGTRDHARHRVRAGRWERPEPHVFCLAGSRPTWRRALMVACLAWGERSAVSHRAAGALWPLAGAWPEVVEVTVPPDRRRTVGGGVAHRNRLPHVDTAVLDGIPVTTPTRTLIDLAAVAPPGAVEEALDDALRRGLTSIPRLAWRLDRLGRRPGAGPMRTLMRARRAGSVPQSVFETRLLRVMRRAGLPAPERQHVVMRGGRVVAVLDFAYPELRLAIEADGYAWHSGRSRWEHDRARLNELTLLGWRVIHVTWSELENDPAGVIDRIRHARAVRMA